MPKNCQFYYYLTKRQISFIIYNMKILSIAIISKLAVIVTAADCKVQAFSQSGCDQVNGQPWLWRVSMVLSSYTHVPQYHDVLV